MTPAFDIPDRHPCAEAPGPVVTVRPLAVTVDRATYALFATAFAVAPGAPLAIVCGSDMLTVRRADACPK